jgi:5-methylcytosine-specific restriction endonuclease McrA
MNRWNIPAELEAEVMARDTCCIYCGVDFTPAGQGRGRRASWEHIVNDARIITRENIARCCMSCNASKGAKELRDWLESPYCLRKGITSRTVSMVVKAQLAQLTSNWV